ncbi:MAG: TlpA family protein disulfide reductase [Micromonosporaceae bacterium]
MPEWLTGAVVALVAVAAATGLGLWWRRRNGRIRELPAGTDPALGAPDQRVLLELGVRPGVPATLLQFSSAFCAPCRATRRICTDVAAMLDGVRHVEVDAEHHLDAVRALGVLRTPTLFVIDAHGRVVRRASGQPTKAHVIASVAPLLEPGAGRPG